MVLFVLFKYFIIVFNDVIKRFLLWELLCKFNDNMFFKEFLNVDGVEVNVCFLVFLKLVLSIIFLLIIIGKFLCLVFLIVFFEDRDLDIIFIIFIFKLYLLICINR